jgi:hypothetical protein
MQGYCGITRFANVDIKINNQWEASLIRFSLTHSFGNATIKNQALSGGN